MDNDTEKQGFWHLLGRHWFELLILVLTATRTYDIVAATAAAVYIPAAGVAIMEGAWFFWNYFFEVSKTGSQRIFAMIGLVLTWVIIGLTSAADVVWIASQRGYFDIGTMPSWASTVATFGVVAVGMLHLALWGFYQNLDPDTSLLREHNEKVREIKSQERSVMLERKRAQMNAKLLGWKANMSRAGQIMGQLDFREEFHKAYGCYPEDLDQKAKRLPAGAPLIEVLPSENGKAIFNQETQSNGVGDGPNFIKAGKG